MKKIAVAMLALATAVPLSGCIAVASPAIGTLYTNVKGPIDAEGPVGSRTGRACAGSLLSLIATGDASISAAAANGGIREVTTVEHESTNLLGIYGEFCTIVHGN